MDGAKLLISLTQYEATQYKGKKKLKFVYVQVDYYWFHLHFYVFYECNISTNLDFTY